ncbi:hypothetical protein BH10ACI1_BH10ACI1_04710 [soil metagenome]
MKTLKILLILGFYIFCFGCNSQVEQKIEKKNEFLEVRINRWTALEGGEILILRKINNDWSAMLIGDGDRFSCYYQKAVQPKSGWENFWNAIQKEGLLEIPDGQRGFCSGCTDGSGFIVEVSYQDKLKRYSLRIPEASKTKESKQILNIGDLISQEFDTPVFVSDYDRGKVGEYLIETCKDLRESNKNS